MTPYVKRGYRWPSVPRQLRLDTIEGIRSDATAIRDTMRVDAGDDVVAMEEVARAYEAAARFLLDVEQANVVRIADIVRRGDTEALGTDE